MWVVVATIAAVAHSTYFFGSREIAMHVLSLESAADKLTCVLVDTRTKRILERQVFDPLRSTSCGTRQMKAIRAVPAFSQATCVAHRVAHAGHLFRTHTRIDDDVVADIAAAGGLAVEANSHAVFAICRARAEWPRLPHAAVFETAFHEGLPDYAATYAVPRSWRALDIRRRGSHGLAHQSAWEAVSHSSAMPAGAMRVVSCVLGPESSVCAILGGRSIDISSGLSSLEGPPGLRSTGSFDVGIALRLPSLLARTNEQIGHELASASGLASLLEDDCGFEELVERSDRGDVSARRAFEFVAYQFAKQVGAAAVALGGLDVVTFIGVGGEHIEGLIAGICARLKCLGVAWSAREQQCDDDDDTRPVGHPRSSVDVEILTDTSFVTTAVLGARCIERTRASPLPASVAESARGFVREVYVDIDDATAAGLVRPEETVGDGTVATLIDATEA